MRKRLFESFSGGRTSGMMLRLIRDRHLADYETVTLFANTGLENEATLQFVDRCDREWGLGVVWLEAVVHPGSRIGTTHRVVDYLTASRKGEPFEAMIRKYGIPNKNFPHCTRETKLRPMTSYLRSIGWEAGSYQTAIGIRADEIDRMSPSAEASDYWYPLVNWGIRKCDVLDWWSRQPFDLRLREHLGNCEACWKKSTRKLLTLTQEKAAAFDFTRRMESEYPDAGAGTGKRVFFRGAMSTDQLFALAEKPFDRFVDNHPRNDPDLDVGGACGESCEIGADEEAELLTADIADGTHPHAGEDHGTPQKSQDLCT